MAAILLIALRAVHVACTRLDVVRLRLPLRALPVPFEGYTIALIADLHTGLPGSLGQAQRAIDAVRAASPDLIILLGDFGFSYHLARTPSRLGYRRSMRLLTPKLRTLVAPNGVIAVLGNHDHYFDAAAVRHWLESFGVDVLVNSHRVIERDGARIVILGVDDAKEGVVDVAAAANGAPHDAPRLLLSHNPDGAYAIDSRTRVDVVISGHTHGGQVVLPVYGAPLRFCRICGRKNARGWVPNDRAPLYVTSGVGGMIPIRINVPPEIVVVRLERADRSAAGVGARPSDPPAARADALEQRERAR